MLCESRSHHVETTDPTGARTIDELKRQLREVRAELESERVKSRQLVSQCEKNVQRVKEEGDVKLAVSLEALAIRKEQERANDILKVEERIKKEWENELRTWEREKVDEFARAQRKWQHERYEDVRRSVREERERCYRDISSTEQEEVYAKQDKITRELFVLSQQNAQLEDQLFNLLRENKGQIEQMRRMKNEHENEIVDIVRKHRNEASRDYAQLHLAEQIIAEKEQDLHLVESRAERNRIEKEQLAEEVAAIRSIKNLSISEPSESTIASPPPTRKSVGGVSGMLQRRIEELEFNIKKVEEDKLNLKFENASLRKRLVLETPGEGQVGGKEANDEKMRKLRKRNTELVTLVKTLDDKCKGLKTDYEQLQKSGSTPSESEQQLRKILNRQHAKDIMDYTKQIHAKDREIGDLRRRVAKLEVPAKPQPEPAPELEKKMKIMAVDKLKMEKLVAKLCSKIPDEDDNSVLSRTGVECEASCVEALDLENQSLKKELAELHRNVAGGEEVDLSETRSEGVTLETEVMRLRKEVDRLSQYESETVSLRESVDETQFENSELKQYCYKLNQQLEVSQLAVRELQGNAEQANLLEEELDRIRQDSRHDKDKTKQLEEACERAATELLVREEQIGTLMRRVEASDDLVLEREMECQKLQTRLHNLVDARTLSEVGIQTDKPSTDLQSNISSEIRVNDSILSPANRELARVKASSPKTSIDHLDSSLESELKVVGVELTDPYDSSEGVGFSDTNLDDTQESIQSVDSVRIDREVVTEGPPTLLSSQCPNRNQYSDPSLLVSGLPVARPITEKLAKVEETKVEREESEDEDADPFHSTPEPSLQHEYSLFIAKFSYNPSQQSPNPTFDLELPLVAGQYLYVYGDMDNDMFYQGRLTNGQTGLVPSNFVEKVSDPGEEAPQPSRHRQLSNLQDIEELDEEISCADSLTSGHELTPPTNLKVERQFVDGQETSVALHWDCSLPCPPQVTGFNVYMNGICKMSVSGCEERTALVSNVPMSQLVKITVRTVYEYGESPDNATPILLNPQYPDPPHNILLSMSNSPMSILVHFSPSSPHKHSTVTSYCLFINQQPCTQLEVTESTSFQDTFCALILPKGVLHLERELTSALSVELTILAHADDHESIPSMPVQVPREYIAHLLLGREIESSVSSASSIELEDSYSPEKREIDLHLIHSTKMESSADRDHVIQDNNHMTNGVTERRSVRYFRAQYSYDPHYQSPNEEEGVAEELSFNDGDIIVSRGEIGQDGFFEGTCNGQTGLVPSNMVEEITDQQELSLLNIASPHEPPSEDCPSANGHNDTSVFPSSDGQACMMRAMHDYDPSQDSPNDNSEVELAFSEGDLITVLGLPDDDGFLEAELKGKKGIVPHNFLESVENDSIGTTMSSWTDPSPSDVGLFESDLKSKQSKLKNTHDQQADNTLRTISTD